MDKFMVTIVVIALIANLFVIWLIGSAVTSGVKSISDDCGKAYGIEKVFSGNWFCPE